MKEVIDIYLNMFKDVFKLDVKHLEKMTNGHLDMIKKIDIYEIQKNLSYCYKTDNKNKVLFVICKTGQKIENINYFIVNFGEAIELKMILKIFCNMQNDILRFEKKINSITLENSHWKEAFLLSNGEDNKFLYFDEYGAFVKGFYVKVFNEYKVKYAKWHTIAIEIKDENFVQSVFEKLNQIQLILKEKNVLSLEYITRDENVFYIIGRSFDYGEIFKTLQNIEKELSLIEDDFLDEKLDFFICVAMHTEYNKYFNNALDSLNNIQCAFEYVKSNNKVEKIPNNFKDIYDSCFLDKKYDNICILTQNLLEEILNEEKLAKELKQGLENKELFVVFQPKINKFGELESFEALTRWKSSNRGLVYPNIFIPLAEKYNLIFKLEEYVLDRVLDIMQKMISKGYVYSVGVNFSPLHIVKENFLKNLENNVNHYNIPRQLVDIEITETSFVDLNKAKDVVCKLRELGYTVSLDDFGTGYSSFERIQELDFKYIKIDKSLIDKLNINPAITDAIISMAHSIGMKVVAEGVEENSQVKILNKLNCDYIQGFYFDKPLEEFDLFNKIRFNNYKDKFEKALKE